MIPTGHGYLNPSISPQRISFVRDAAMVPTMRPVVMSTTAEVKTKKIHISWRGRSEEIQVSNKNTKGDVKDLIKEIFEGMDSEVVLQHQGCSVIPTYDGIVEGEIYTVRDSKYTTPTTTSPSPSHHIMSSPGHVTVTKRVDVNQTLQQTYSTSGKTIRAVLIGVAYQRKPRYTLDSSVINSSVMKMRQLIESRYSDGDSNSNIEIAQVIEDVHEGGVVLKKGGTRRRDIIRWAEWLASSTADVKLFYFIGHAAVVSRPTTLADQTVNEEMLLPSDFSLSANDPMVAAPSADSNPYNGIRSSDLLSAFHSAGGKSNITCVFDCSYTGTVLSLKSSLRLFSIGSEMIEQKHDEDLNSSTDAPTVSVLSLIRTSESAFNQPVLGIITSCITNTLSDHQNPSQLISNEKYLSAVAAYLRRFHPNAGVCPLVSGSRELMFGSPLNF